MSEKAICVRCKYCQRPVLLGDSRKDQFLCFNIALPVNPITGHGLCCDFNTDGKCTGFQQRPEPGTIKGSWRNFLWRRP